MCGEDEQVALLGAIGGHWGREEGRTEGRVDASGLSLDHGGGEARDRDGELRTDGRLSSRINEGFDFVTVDFDVWESGGERGR